MRSLSRVKYALDNSAICRFFPGSSYSMHVVNYRGAGPLEHRQLASQWVRIATLTI